MSDPHPSVLKQAIVLADENPGCLVVLLNQSGGIEYVSPLSVRITGFKPEEAVGHPFANFVHPDDLPDLQTAVQHDPLGEKSPEVGLRVRQKSGGALPMRGYGIKVLDPASGAVYILAVAQATV